MANRSLGTLTLDLLMKIGGFQKGADQAARTSAKLRKQLEADMAAIRGIFRVAGAFGAALGTQQLLQAGAAAIEYGDEILKASKKTGIAVEEMSSLAQVADLNDIELTSLSTALKKMQVTMSEAASGSKAANETLAALGLTIADLKNQAPDKQFETLADRISRLKDPADRVRAAVDLFGKAGADLLPMMEQGAAGIRKAREEIERLGGALTQEQAQALADADDAIKRLHQSWNDFARDLTAKVAPALTYVFDTLANADQARILQTRAQQIEALLTSRGPTVEQFADTAALRAELADIERQLAALEEAERRLLLGAGRQATRPEAPPGFQPEPDKTKAPTTDEWLEAMGLGEIPIAVAEISKNAYDQMLDEFDERTATAREKQLAEWHQFDAELQTLLAEGLDPSIAAERNKEFIEKMLPDIELTAEKIIPPKEVEKASEFYLEAMRNTQDIVADTLVNGFDEGVDGMLKSFADMLYKMAAQAAAAKIGELLFSGLAGMGGFFGNLFGGFFESGGFIAPGQFGVVGESGPEIVMGGRTGQTVVPMQPAAAQPVVNLRNINAFDTDVIRDYLLSAQGEQVMLNFIQRNGSRVRAASVGR